MSPPVVPVNMYDSVNPGLIPGNVRMVAGYMDGDYAWTKEDWGRFPGAEKVIITVRGSLTGNVADVENGDMTPEQAPGWINAKQQAGKRGATIYCNRATMSTVQHYCRGHAYYLWVADWTGVAHIIPGTVAVQYKTVPDTYDISSVSSQKWLDAINQANRPWPL